MKTKRERERLSKERQKNAKELVLWSQKVVDLIHKTRVDPEPDTHLKLAFCQKEEKKCKVEMRNLNGSCYLQQRWVKG